MTDVRPLPARRGRPPSEAARRAILDAAASLLNDRGIGAVTVEATAALAKVGKPTIYRYFANAEALVMAALIADAPSPPEAAAGSALEALRAQLRHIADRFATRRGAQAARMAASADGDSEVGKAFRGHVMLSSRSDGGALLERAIANGEIGSDIDIEVALDALYGALFFRVLIGHAAATPAFTDALLDQALAGLGAGRTREPNVRRL